MRRAVLFSSRGDKTRLELFRRGVVELQTSQPLVCSHVATVRSPPRGAAALPGGWANRYRPGYDLLRSDPIVFGTAIAAREVVA